MNKTTPLKPSRFKKPAYHLLLCVLVILGWANPAHDQVMQELEKEQLLSSESVKLLSELHLSAQANASTSIPVVSGLFDAAAQDLKQKKYYVSIAMAVLNLNSRLLTTSKTPLFPILIALMWIISLRKPLGAMAWKLLFLSACINPGVGLFTFAGQQVTHKLITTSHDSFHTQLQQIHHDYLQKEKARQQKIALRNKRELEKDKQKGKNHLTLAQQAGNHLSDFSSDVGLHLAEDFKLSTKAIRFAAGKLIAPLIGYLASIIFIYFLLPTAYLLTAYDWIRSWYHRHHPEN